MAIIAHQETGSHPILRFQFPTNHNVPPHEDACVILLAQQYQIPSSYQGCLQILIDKDVLGLKAQEEGWNNVGEHCIKCFHMGHAFCDLLGLEPEAQERLCSKILVHDEDLRINKEKEGHNSGSHMENGVLRLHPTLDFFRDDNQQYEGIRDVTSMDWRDWEDWSLPQQVLRYVDSCVGPVNGQGRDVYMHWSERINGFARLKREMDIMYGKMWYLGSSFQDDDGTERPSAFAYLLRVVMPGIEQSLFDAIEEANPHIVSGKEASDLFDIICGKLNENFAGNLEQTL